MEQRTIPELKEKLRSLMKSEIARAVGRYNNTVNSFGEATDIGRDTVRNILGPKKNETLREDHERKLVTHCKFRIDMTEWRTGTAKEFIAAYEHRQAAHDRRTDFELTRGPDIEPEPSPIKGLALVQIFAAQYDRGQVDIGFELSCGRLRGPYGLTIQIRSGTIELGCFPASLRRSTRKGFDKGWPWSGSQGPVTFEWGAGSTFTGRWRVTASGKSIGNLDVPADFVTVENLAPGDEITLSFGFRVKDLTPTIDDGTILFEDGSSEGDDVSIEPPAAPATPIEPQKLSAAKQAILARLATEALVDEGDGFVVHTRHRIGLIEKTPMGERIDVRTQTR